MTNPSYEEVENLTARACAEVVPFNLDIEQPWPDPVPLARQPDPPEPYPVDSLGTLAGAARAIADVTQAPIALAAQSVLTVASFAAQQFVDVELLHGSAPASLFAVTVARSGERKSAVDRIAMKAVREYEMELADSYQDALIDQEQAVTAWGRDRKEVLAKYSGSALLEALADLGPEPAPPLLPSLIMSDPTVEAITKSMRIGRPSRGVFSDEGGLMLGGHGMTAENRTKTLTAFSKFWDADPISRARAGDGVDTFRGRRIALHLMVQPAIAEGILGDRLANGQGFLARCLVVWPESTVGERFHKDPSPESLQAIDAFNAGIGVLLRDDPPLREGSRNELQTELLTLQAAARQRLIKAHDGIERAMGLNGRLDGVRAFASKYCEHVCRIAAVICVYEGLTAIPEAKIIDAARLASHYLSEARRLMGAAQLSPATREAETLRIWLIDRWDEPFISATDVVQRGPAAFRETAKAKRLLDVLVKHGWLRPAKGGAIIMGKKRRAAFEIYPGEVGHVDG